jgi:hypothetical protein
MSSPPIQAREECDTGMFILLEIIFNYNDNESLFNYCCEEQEFTSIAKTLDYLLEGSVYFSQ